MNAAVAARNIAALNVAFDGHDAYPCRPALYKHSGPKCAHSRLGMSRVTIRARAAPYNCQLIRSSTEYIPRHIRREYIIIIVNLELNARRSLMLLLLSSSIWFYPVQSS